jgi:hypothetical protein
VKTEFECPLCGLEISFVVTPGTDPARRWSLPFSDPGEGSDIDGPDNCPECGREITERDKEKMIMEATP